MSYHTTDSNPYCGTPNRFEAKYGVPQGSCQGPRFSSIQASCSRLSNVICAMSIAYVNDRQFHISFKANFIEEQSAALEDKKSRIADFREWMLSATLKLNDAKRYLGEIFNRLTRVFTARSQPYLGFMMLFWGRLITTDLLPCYYLTCCIWSNRAWNFVISSWILLWH